MLISLSCALRHFNCSKCDHLIKMKVLNKLKEVFIAGEEMYIR